MPVDDVLRLRVGLNALRGAVFSADFARVNATAPLGREGPTRLLDFTQWTDSARDGDHWLLPVPLADVTWPASAAGSYLKTGAAKSTPPKSR